MKAMQRRSRRTATDELCRWRVEMTDINRWSVLAGAAILLLSALLSVAKHPARRACVRAVLGLVLALNLTWSTPGKACTWTARPNVTLGLDSTTNQPGTELKALIEHWSVGCASADCPVNDATKFWDGIELHYWSEPDSILEVNSLGPEQSAGEHNMGDFVVDAPVFGVKIFGVFRAGCGDTVSSTMLLEARSEPIVMAPNLPELNQIAVFVDDPAFPRGLTVVEPLQIPLNYRFHIHSEILADPRGAEVATVHVNGGGIDFTKNYPADANVSSGEQFYNDPDADLLPTRLEPIKFWVEFEGVSSPTRQLMVVPYDQDGRPIPNSNGGSSGGGSDGTGTGGQGAAGDPSSGTGAMAAGDSGAPSNGDADAGDSGGQAGDLGSPAKSGNGGGCSLARERSPGSALLVLLLALGWCARTRAGRSRRSFKR
jgi:hypothetical protein